MAFLVILAFVVVAAGGAYLSYYLKQKRRAELATMATQLGLEYSTVDTQGCLALPFALLSKGDGRGTENVMWGTWKDTPMTEFDYWYYEESTDSEGHRTKTYYRFSCAVTEIEAFCAHLTIDRENLFTRIADHMGLHDVEFESDDFNRSFNVKCKDRKFANDFIDARMMQHLLLVDHAFQFEVSSKWLLCFSKKRPPMDLIPLIGTLKQFRDQVPRVVYELYGVGQQQVG
jgi:hypothetical protein